jgi:molybdopterin-biosynthesis enzyme MoeA-like protein
MANPTACILIIGNEVLSGRTRDANIQFLATELANWAFRCAKCASSPMTR